jgi:hypothetical protein
VKTIFDPNKYLEGGRFISFQVWHILLNNWKLKLNAFQTNIHVSHEILFSHLMERKSGNGKGSPTTDRSIDSTVMTPILFLFY